MKRLGFILFCLFILVGCYTKKISNGGIIKQINKSEFLFFKSYKCIENNKKCRIYFYPNIHFSYVLLFEGDKNINLIPNYFLYDDSDKIQKKLMDIL